MSTVGPRNPWITPKARFHYSSYSGDPMQRSVIVATSLEVVSRKLYLLRVERVINWMSRWGR